MTTVQATFSFRKTPNALSALGDVFEEAIARVLTDAGFASLSGDDITSVLDEKASQEEGRGCSISLRLSGGHRAVVDATCCEAIADAILLYLPDGVGCKVSVEPAPARA